MASAPPNFRLQQLEENARPPVGVPQYLKHQVYSDPSVFKRVDDHAIQVSQSNHRTFRDFVFHLVYSQNFNELEKARAIFRWMTSKNMHTIQFQQEPQGSPEEVLTSFRNKKGTYARIYEVICSFSGLHCITLSGYAKGVDYKPGGRLSGSPFNHSWNAVFINGSYIQVDCHWATRYLTSEKNVPENLVYEYDDFYFMTEPQELIYSHWPEEKGWQLLARPLSLAQFEDLPLAKSFFFKCGMQFLNQNRGIINMQNGRLNMSLGYTKPAAFTFKLVYGEYNEEEYRNTKLKRYVLQETLDNMVNFYIRSPREGPYYLTIYSQEVSDKLDVETVFKAACEYKVISDRAADDAVPYPVASDSNWGPGAPVQQYGLTPSHREAVIIAVGGKSEVRFTQSRKVRILCKLTRPGKDDALLEQYVTERSEGQDLVVETALPPNMKGEYALEVYGNDPAKDGDTFTHMCQYLLAYPDSDRKEGAGDLKSYQTYSQTSSYSTSTTSSTTYGQDGYQVTGAPGSRYQPTTVQTHGPVSVQPTQPGRDSPGGGYQPGYQQNQPGQPGYQQTQPGQYGYQPERVSPVPGFQPGRASPQTGYQPGQPGYQPGQPGYQPGRASPQSGYQPGRASPQSGYQPGYQPGQPGYQQQGAPAGSHEQQPSGIYQATPATTYNVALAPGQQPEANEPGSNLTFKKATHKPGEYQPSTGYTYKPATGIPGPDSKQAEARYSETLTVQIKPPADFTPQPIQQATPAPAPAPPKPVQEQVTEAPPQKVFQYVDKHAVEVSKMQHDSFRDLVWHLIYARNITNELEKARAIFLWLCTKDLKNMRFDNVQKDSPEEILMGLKDGRTTYAQIYETLCSYAGLHCVTLGGYAKGADYRPGMKFTGDQGKHSWNAVLINGTWRLVDCHWAARRLVGKQVTLENVRYELDEYYFLPDPHQLILTHFPDNQEWELLERPVTLQDFENLVPVKSAFFKYGLQMVSHKEAIINCNEEAVVQVACPPYRGNTIAFTFTLAYEDGREEYQGTKLNRFGMQEMVDNISNFRLRPPEVGNYQVIIYAKDVTIETKEGVYGAVCEYRLVCQRAPRPRPFPPVVHTSYGPGDRAGQYQLVPMQRGATVRTVNGKAEVALRMPAELRFMGKLKANDRDEKELDGFVMHRVTNDLAIFTISAPGMGEYGLEIYANDPAKDGNSLFHVWQYLVVCEEAKVQAAPMPKLPPGYLGAQPAFNKLGLSVHSHSDPYIQVDQGELTLKLNSSQPCRMTSQLLYAENSEDYTDYVLQQTKNNQVIFMLKFPKAGLYKFQLFGLPYSDTSESLPGVYNYVINCSMTYSSLVPFPRQFAQWKEGCYLHEPLEGQIPANRPNKGSASSHQHIFFRVEVPKASAVAIVIGEDWTQLDEKQAGLWEGEVSMQGLWGREDKAALCANYGSFKASYSTLLEFSL